MGQLVTLFDGDNLIPHSWNVKEVYLDGNEVRLVGSVYNPEEILSSSPKPRLATTLAIRMDKEAATQLYAKLHALILTMGLPLPPVV